MQHTETNLKKPLVGFGSQVKMGPKNTQEKLHYQILCNMPNLVHTQQGWLPL